MPDDFDEAGQCHTDAALLLLLDDLRPGDFAGLAGAVVYTGGPTLNVPLIERAVKSRDGCHTYKLLAVALSAAEARAFVFSLHSGPKTIPQTDYTCAFSFGHVETGFTSREQHGWNQTGENQLLLGSAHWTRRHRSTTKALHGHELDIGTVDRIVAALPRGLPVRFRILDLERRLEALGDVFELLESPVEFVTSTTDSTMTYTLRALLGPQDADYRLALRSYRSQLYASVTVHDVLPGTDTILLPDNVGRVDWELTRNGILVDSYSGAFINTVSINAGISPGKITINPDDSGDEPVRLDIAPAAYIHATAGKQQTPSAISNKVVLAAQAWRAELAQSRSFQEHVFTAFPPRSRREGLRYLAELVSYAVGEQQTKDIYVVDQYGIDRPALLRVAAAAAKIPGGTLHLLTKNLPPPPSPATVSPQAADYEALAAQVSSRLSVRILRFTPTRDIHDRYLWIGNRVWHVGSSLNQLGSDVSAI